MRISEITNAENQLALWKIVSDSVWSAVSQQAAAEQQTSDAAAAHQRTLKTSADSAAPPHTVSASASPIRKKPVPHAAVDPIKPAARQKSTLAKKNKSIAQQTAQTNKQQTPLDTTKVKPNIASIKAVPTQQPIEAQPPLTLKQMRFNSALKASTAKLGNKTTVL